MQSNSNIHIYYVCLFFSIHHVVCIQSTCYHSHTKNKLTENNFIDWKRNLDIVLTAEDHAYVLTTPCPEEPVVSAMAAARRKFKKWRKSNGMARYYMLAFMASVLQHQFQSNKFTSTIMTILKKCLGSMVGLLGRLLCKRS